MAEIRRIGHDHQAPFWYLLVVVVLGNQVATRGEIKLVNTNISRTPPQPQTSFVTHHIRSTQSCRLLSDASSKGMKLIASTYTAREGSKIEHVWTDQTKGIFCDQKPQVS